jgi:uncharacterized membrane protein SirB2
MKKIIIFLITIAILMIAAHFVFNHIHAYLGICVYLVIIYIILSEIEKIYKKHINKHNNKKQS